MQISIITLLLGLMMYLPPAFSKGNNNESLCKPSSHAEFDVEPEILWTTRPVYPENLRQSGNIGGVLLALSIASDGTARDFEIRKSDHPSLESAVLDALLKARFKPALKGGKPINSSVCLPVKFQTSLSAVSASGANLYSIPQESPSGLPEEMQFDQPPTPLIITAPVYPFDLARQDIEGSAKVSFLIGLNGKVVKTEIIEATHPDFGLATAAMLESWQFEPALKKSKKSYAFFMMEVEFSSTNRDTRLSNSARRLLSLVKDSPAKIYELKDLDKVPKALYQVVPVYPRRYVQEGVKDTVILEFFLDERGTVQLPRIVSAKSLPLAWSAATALARWRFEPPLHGGEQVSAKMQIPFEFKLTDSAL